MVDPTDYAAIEGATAPVFSQDGRTLFHLRGAGQAQLWALDLARRSAWQLTNHDERISLVRRAPNDDRLIYAIDAGGDERHQLWLWQDGVSRPLTTAPAVIHTCGAWSPDGTQVSLTANDRDEAHFDLVVMEVDAGTQTRLMDGVHEATVGGWSKEAKSLLVIQDRCTSDQRPFAVAPDGTATPLPRGARSRFSSLRWDAEALLGLTDAGGRAFLALCRIDPRSGETVPEYEVSGRDVEAWSLSSAGLLATVENDRGWSVLRVGARGGERPVVPTEPGVIADLAWSPDGSRLAFSASTPTRPAGLFVWHAGTVEPVWSPDCTLPFRDFTLVEWTSFDGKRIPGWFALPGGPAPASGVPAVIWVHGGPAAQCRGNFRADMQALLAQGYAVLMPNVRGSTGYGNASMDADDVERRLDSVQDLAAGQAWLAAQPGVDPARIAVMGQSYGGFMVLSAVTEHPTLWRCAIDFYGIADFGTLLDATGPWRRAHRAAEYGDPIRHRALFDRISPLRHVDRVTVPMLVLHGVRDPRVAIGESEQWVEALRVRQAPVRYEVFDYAGHGFHRAEDKRRVYAAVADFLRESLSVT